MSPPALPLKRNPKPLAHSAVLRYKVYEAILTVGADKFANCDIRLRVTGGGHVSQMYALRQAIAKGIVAFYAKNEDAASALELKKALIQYDRTLLVADPRRMEPKKVRSRRVTSQACLLTHPSLPVRWSWCPSKATEILPLKNSPSSSLRFCILPHSTPVSWSPWLSQILLVLCSRFLSKHHEQGLAMVARDA